MFFSIFFANCLADIPFHADSCVTGRGCVNWRIAFVIVQLPVFYHKIPSALYKKIRTKQQQL
jgi:hypothetical protein